MNTNADFPGLKGRNIFFFAKIYSALSGLIKNVNASSQGVVSLCPGLSYPALSALKFGVFVVCLLLVSITAFAQSKLPYENNFEKAEVGKVSEDMLVLDGQFSVKEESGNKVLELPGDPLDSFGVLFGPTETSNIVVTAKIFGTGKGRRFPTFAIGSNGVNGYRLQVSPGKKLLELYKRDEVVKSVTYDFKSGEWTHLKLQVGFVKEGQFKVEGKAWIKGVDEPKEALINYEDNSPASPGRASTWGSPYSGTPILFDDLSVSRSEGK